MLVCMYPTHTIADLKALYAEETEVFVHLFVSECLLRLVEVVFQVFLYLLSATEKKRRGESSYGALRNTKACNLISVLGTIK